MMTLKELLSAYRYMDKPLYVVLEDISEDVSAGIIYSATFTNITDIVSNFIKNQKLLLQNLILFVYFSYFVQIFKLQRGKLCDIYF